MATSDIPDVRDTDLDRADLEEAAQELGLEDHDDLQDQELFEEIGRRLGEIDEDASAEHDRTDDESSSEETDDQMGDDTGPDPQDMTRDELRDELRELDLPVSGSKSELLDRLETARKAAADAAGQVTEAAGDAEETAEDTADEASKAAEDTAGEAKDTAEETAGQAKETAEGTAGQAQEAAEDTAGEAKETAEKTAEDATEAAEGTAAEARRAGTEDEEALEQDPEYRLEEDQREGVVPLLDVEVGPLALDLLGVEVRLNRLHPVIVVNREPKHALLGKLLSGVAGTADKLGLSKGAGTAVEGVEKLVDKLPSPSGDDGTGAGGDDGGDGEESDDGGGGGVLRRMGSRVVNAAQSAGSAAGSVAGAAGSAGHALKDAVTSGGKVEAASEAKDAKDDLGDAVESGKDALHGR
jgi:hypothetical protein